MARIRAFEEAAEEASLGGVQAFGAASTGAAKVRGPLHLSIGQEAVAAGVCAHLQRDDLLTSTHRGHGHTLAKGADVNKHDGRAVRPRRRSQRRQGRLDAHRRLLGRHARRQRRRGGGSADRLRRGAGAEDPEAGRTSWPASSATARSTAGPFLEALNWAAVYKLPLLFVCEDNRYSATTDTAAMTAGEGAAARARAIGVPGDACDGNDVAAVSALAQRLDRDRARRRRAAAAARAHLARERPRVGRRPGLPRHRRHRCRARRRPAAARARTV